MIEVNDVNRGLVYVNPEKIQLLHAEGQGCAIVLEQVVIIAKDSVMTILSRMDDEKGKVY